MKRTCDNQHELVWSLFFSRQVSLYASGGNENKIKNIYSISDEGKLAQTDNIVMGKPWPNHISPSGIVISKIWSV